MTEYFRATQAVFSRLAGQLRGAMRAALDAERETQPDAQTLLRELDGVYPVFSETALPDSPAASAPPAVFRPDAPDSPASAGSAAAQAAGGDFSAPETREDAAAGAGRLDFSAVSRWFERDARRFEG